MIAMILALTLSFHAFLEGLAVGITQNTGEALAISIAIIAHKAIEGFAIGINIFRAFRKSKFLVVMYVFIYSLASPIGTTVGIIVYNFHDPLASSILIALSSGTFLYAGTFEFTHILDGVKNMRKMMFSFFGFTIMAVVAIWT
ncbi:zinc transporter zip1 [Anaeramoeba ignava]|uniref:Zinc transporter zip1 n=1 Tax=Anaeramoeba ignava TaxID=1746090 RepID=A0A9Q0LHS0_ANAIG|nr:zinc transporter zip1 [Anaeramoeba ignava]